MDLTERLDQFTDEIKLKYVGAGLLVVVGLALIAGAQLTQTPDGNQIQVNLTVDYGNSVDSKIVRVNNTSSAFHALNATYPVEYQESSFGLYITGINGVSSNKTHYWIYKVDGEAPKVGAGQYELTGGEKVTFSLMSSQEAKNATS
ncbi:MAG: DUF4430 domain-containing protein [Candidatus Nanohalobium sp.]